MSLLVFRLSLFMLLDIFGLLFLYCKCVSLCERLVSVALQKMKGKISENSSFHVSSRVLQVIGLRVLLWC